MNFIKTNYHISRLGSAHVTSHLLAQLQIVSPVWTPIGMIEFSSILHCSWVDWEDRIFHLAPCMQCHLSGHCTARLYYCTSFALQKSVWDILVVWKNKFHSTSPVPYLKNLRILHLTLISRVKKLMTNNIYKIYIQLSYLFVVIRTSPSNHL